MGLGTVLEELEVWVRKSSREDSEEPEHFIYAADPSYELSNDKFSHRKRISDILF
jgi:hypothetical protein